MKLKTFRWATAVAAVGGAVLLLLSDTPVLRAQQGGQLPVFTARVELVRVDVQVVQRTGNPIIGLGLDDFQAWLDGHSAAGNGRWLARRKCYALSG